MMEDLKNDHNWEQSLLSENTPSSNNHQHWILESGATSHMTGNSAHFHEQNEVNVQVKMANDDHVIGSKRGLVTLRTMVENSEQTLKLKDVLFIEGL